MGDEWGPWIEHDGKGCPCLGMFVESQERCGVVEQHIAGGIGIWPVQWFWGQTQPQWEIVRYRIRRPAALKTLIEIAANPAPLPELVPA